MTAPSSATLLPTSFVAFVATLAIWLVIVPIVNAELIGATTTTEAAMVDVDHALLEQAMLLTVKWRYVYTLLIVLKRIVLTYCAATYARTFRRWRWPQR